MRAGEVFLAGQTHLLRRTGEGVPENKVQSRTGLVVETRLLRRPQGVVPLRPDRREPFGADDRLAVDMGRTGGLLDEEAILVAGPVRRGHPEFAHRPVAAPVTFQAIQRPGVRTGGFGLDAHAVPVGQSGHRPIMVVGHTVGNGAAEIGQEAVAGVATIDDAAGEDWQPGAQVVAPAPVELRRESRGPIDAA